MAPRIHEHIHDEQVFAMTTRRFEWQTVVMSGAQTAQQFYDMYLISPCTPGKRFNCQEHRNNEKHLNRFRKRSKTEKVLRNNLNMQLSPKGYS
eukprot:5247678-Amphidinium_carterae.1